MKTPMIKAIEDAKGKFLAKYGFPADMIHVSPAMERALHRWAKKTLDLSRGARDAEIAGLGVVRSTKPSPHVEFWLSNTRGSRVFTVHAMLEPEDVGGVKVTHPGETVLDFL